MEKNNHISQKNALKNDSYDSVGLFFDNVDCQSQLFILFWLLKNMAIAIRQNSEIKGIFIGKEETKLLQYADDSTAILSDKNSATALFKLLDFFRSVSGLKINCTKTEGMWIGSAKHSKSKPFGIKWPDEPIKALGVYFTYDIKLLHEKNFIKRLDSIKNL